MSTAISRESVQEAINLLRQAAPASTIVLFGSYARGDAGPDSDLDFLVIEPSVKSRREEMVRLRDVLRPLGIPVDVLVTSEAAFHEWSDTPGTVLHEAKLEGQFFGA